MFTIPLANRVSTLVKSQVPGAPTAVACFSDALFCVAKMFHGGTRQQNTWRLEREEIQYDGGYLEAGWAGHRPTYKYVL